MNNGKTLVAAAVAAMLAAPASHAAIDDAGMQYTSAAEGFYGSLRMDFTSSDIEVAGTKVGDSAGLDVSTSRLGVRGTVDLGGGMSARLQLRVRRERRQRSRDRDYAPAQCRLERRVRLSCSSGRSGRSTTTMCGARPMS